MHHHASPCINILGPWLKMVEDGWRCLKHDNCPVVLGSHSALTSQHTRLAAAVSLHQNLTRVKQRVGTWCDKFVSWIHWSLIYLTCYKVLQRQESAMELHRCLHQLQQVESMLQKPSNYPLTQTLSVLVLLVSGVSYRTTMAAPRVSSAMMTDLSRFPVHCADFKLRHLKVDFMWVIINYGFITYLLMY